MAKGESRLGRGLEALLGEYLDEEQQGPGARERPGRELPLRSIKPNPYQPRADFEDPAIEALAESIRENGLLQPLVVRASAEGGWELVAGERRWRAVRRLGWESVPAVIRELGEEQMLVLALVENLQREDLSPLEEAMGFQRLIEDFELTQAQVAERVGKDRSTVANTLRLLSLPDEVRGLVGAGRLSAGHARAVLMVDGEEAQIALARQVVARGLSVRAAERRARALNGGEEPAEAGDRDRTVEPRDRSGAATDPVARRAEQLLERILGTQVRLRGRGPSGGEITIPWHDAADFERLMRLILGDASSRELFEES